MVHAHIIKTGTFEDKFVTSSLVNVYSNCGRMDYAQKVFDRLPRRNVVSWTGLMTGYIHNSQPKVAIRVFVQMLEVGAYPTIYTFGTILAACSTMLLVKLGMQVHACIVKHGIEFDTSVGIPFVVSVLNVEVYLRLWTYLEGLEKRMLYHGLRLFLRVAIMGIMSQRNLELGYYAAENLLKLKPKDEETYILLLNLYLSAGKYQDVSKRKMMKQEKLGMLQDWSWLNIKDTIYSFSPKSLSSPLKAEIEEYLGMLLDEVKTRGYQYQAPQVAYPEVDDVEAEPLSSSFVRHSEKLAIAFGLSHTSETVPLLIVKSISMCGECHTFIKAISEITGREIIVRDSKRLHRFVNEHCSCGDFGNLI